jgi:hypothetical protein
MVDAQTVGVLVTAASVTIAAIYYIITLRSNNKTRQAQLFMQIYTRVQEPEFMKNWNEVMDRDWKEVVESWKAGGAKTPFQNVSWLSVAMYFEGIGVLLKKGLIDADFVYELMPTRASSYWAKFEPFFREVRTSMNFPQAGRNAEYLAVELNKLAEKRGEPIITSYAMDKVG